MLTGQPFPTTNKMVDRGKVPKKRDPNQSILSLLSKRSPGESDTQETTTVVSYENETRTEVRAPISDLSSSAAESTGIAQRNDSTFSIPVTEPYDFGALLQFFENQLTDDQRYKLVRGLDQPDDFVFPPNIESGQNRSFQSSWFRKYPWLTYTVGKKMGVSVLFVLHSLLIPEYWSSIL